MFLVDAIGRHPEIDFVSTHNEQAAVIAAEAYTRLTNSIGIALVTTGPGATNPYYRHSRCMVGFYTINSNFRPSEAK